MTDCRSGSAINVSSGTNDQGSRNVTTHENRKAEFKQEAAQAGERPRTLESRPTSLNSSTPTKTDTPLSLPNLSAFSMTRSEMDEKHVSLWTSNGTGFVVGSTSTAQEDDGSREVEGEFTIAYTVHVSGYGHFSKEERKIATALMRTLKTAFGDGFDVFDDGGRRVIWDSLHPERPIFFQENSE